MLSLWSWRIVDSSTQSDWPLLIRNRAKPISNHSPVAALRKANANGMWAQAMGSQPARLSSHGVWRLARCPPPSLASVPQAPLMISLAQSSCDREGQLLPSSCLSAGAGLQLLVRNKRGEGAGQEPWAQVWLCPLLIQGRTQSLSRPNDPRPQCT